MHTPMIIVLILILLFLLFWLAAGYYGFQVAMSRGTQLDLNDKERIRGTAWERYYKEITDGISWITAQEYETIAIQSHDGLTLYGNLIPNPDAIGTVIMFHGYRTFGNCDFSADADHYYGLGYHLLIVDQRGCGRSGGKYITFGIKERIDCLQWIDYVTKRFGTGHYIFLGGLSLGASTVLMASGYPLPAHVRGIVADSGFTSPKEIISRTIKHKYHCPSGFLMPVIGLWSKLLARVSLNEYSTLQAMETNQTPLFIIHGKNDDYVPCEMSVSVYKTCRTYKQLFLVDGADHGTGYMVAPELYRQKLTDFFTHCAQERPTDIHS